MTGDRWAAPGPGSWELDDLHKSSTYTRPFLDLFAPAIGEGFAALGEHYGLPFERAEVASVHGWSYGRMVICGAPPPKAGRDDRVPPAWALRVLCRLHPALRRRAKVAAQAVAERRWLAEAERWSEVERPSQVAANLALQERLTSAGTDRHAVAAVVVDAADNLRAGIVRHFRLIGTQIPVARLQRFLAGHGVDPEAALGLLVGTSSASSASQAALAAAQAEVDRAGAVGPWPTIAALRAAAPIAADLVEEHLTTHGHRLIGGSDLDGATLGEHPGTLLAALAAPAPTTPAAPAVLASAAAIRDALPAAARAELDVLLSEARACYGVREDEVGIDISWSGGILRHTLLASGRLLAADGRLSAPDDVFELGLDELAALLRGAATPGRAEVDRRRKERRAADAEVPPPWLGSPPASPPPASVFPPAMADLVDAFGAIRRQLDALPDDRRPAGTGLGVGGTVYEGRARVAHSPDELLADLEPGDVLVTSITTPAFNAVLPLLGGLVTERGGLLSHPAIAARELGIPAVIGVAGALTTIADGAHVVVDPIAGTVTVAERHALEHPRPRA